MFTRKCGLCFATSALVAMAACHGTDDRAAEDSCSAIGNSGGAVRIGDNEIVYAATNDSTGSTVHGVVVVRTSAQARSLQAPKSRPARWQVNGRPIGGATVGPLWIGHEQSTNVVWIDSAAIPLDTNNVLLVEVDAHGTPRTAGQARIPARLPMAFDGCESASHKRRQELFSAALWDQLRESPRVRVFLSR